MDWRRFIEPLRWHTTGLADRLTEAVVQACREPVRQQVFDKLCAADVHEARGYVAARCASRVARESRRILEEQGLRVGRSSVLAQRATQRLVDDILHEMPSAHAVPPRYRKAA